MTTVTLRDVRGLRAQIRRYAHESRCGEFESLVKHWERLGNVDLALVQPQTAAWITEAYVVLTHEIAEMRRDYRAGQRSEPGGPMLTQTVAGVTLGQLLRVLQAVEERPEQYDLPPAGTWTSKVLRLHDAWIWSQHVERYRIDFWGHPSLVNRVAGIVLRSLFP